jgi:hypothetical protein
MPPPKDPEKYKAWIKKISDTSKGRKHSDIKR